MKQYRILLILFALIVIGCQGSNKSWEWVVDGLSEDYRTDDFGDRVSVRYYPKTNEWSFWSAYSKYGPYYYGIAEGVQIETKDGKGYYGTYEFPGRFYIYLSGNRPSSIYNHSYQDEWAELRRIEWKDDECITIKYLVGGETKTCYLHGGIVKNE